MLSHGLTPYALDRLADLEREVVAADGGRLKLEWGTLRSRSGREAEDLLWWDGDRLTGFLGRYAFGGPVELAGMVAPGARGRGVGTALLQAALARCSDDPLLVVPRPSRAGARLAVRHGGALDHSEHALVLDHLPTQVPEDPGLTLRAATPEDAGPVERLLAQGFGHVTSDLHDTLVAERHGEVVATLRVSRDGADAAVHGFVVDAPLQGRGLGGDVLRRACRQARTQGAAAVRLEVAVDNDRALGLYTAVGFRPVVTEDYYLLRTRDADRSQASPRNGSTSGT